MWCRPLGLPVATRLGSSIDPKHRLVEDKKRQLKSIEMTHNNHKNDLPELTAPVGSTEDANGTPGRICHGRPFYMW